MRFLNQGLLIVLWSVAMSAPGAPSLPSGLATFLVRRGEAARVDAFARVRQPSVDAFVRSLPDEPLRFLGAGYNGVAFLGEDRRVYKFSHLIFLSEPIRARWAALWARAEFARFRAEAWERIQVGVNLQPNVLLREVWGAWIWDRFAPWPTPLPECVSNDGLAYVRGLVDGETFQTRLRAGQNIPWNGLVAVQRAAERMLIALGATIDLTNPTNLIVEGTRVRAIDTELVVPDSATIAYYGGGGSAPAPFDVPEGAPWTRWPIVPQHIVQSRAWDLSPEASVTYFQALYDEDAATAAARLAAEPIWRNELFPFLEDRRNVCATTLKNAIAKPE